MNTPNTESKHADHTITDHKIYVADARDMSALASNSVELVVTSPPYPMIKMWDDVFAAQAPRVAELLDRGDGWAAFESMHGVLDTVWSEVHRILVDGGIACINIGDATRTVEDRFALYPNHSRVTSRLLELGFSTLPSILWRKPTNAPNKFMGSGMMPPGAYVTLEHEYVLTVRKGKKREISASDDKSRRRASSYFWEERNRWFSDVWFDLTGTPQRLTSKRGRERSGAFPFDLPYRLINMFSLKSDTVLDPFLGTGTTTFAAMASGRNSVGFESEPEFASQVESRLPDVFDLASTRVQERLRAHAEFVREHQNRGDFGYPNIHYGFPVVTRQETELLLAELVKIERVADLEFRAEYANAPTKAVIEGLEVVTK